jgi:hypothetical protein
MADQRHSHHAPQAQMYGGVHGGLRPQRQVWLELGPARRDGQAGDAVRAEPLRAVGCV